MRPIEFRGKREKDGEWVYGNYVVLHQPVFDKENPEKLSGYTNSYQIFNDEPGKRNTSYWVTVDETTVGQFTGLTDKNGNKIFEGDIMYYHDRYFGVVMWHPYGYFFINDRKDFIICELNVNFTTLGEILKFARMSFEVHGNIHDNSELIK